MGEIGCLSTTYGQAITILWGSLVETPEVGVPPGGEPVVETEIQAGEQKVTVVAKGDLAKRMGKIPRETKVRIAGETKQQDWKTGNVYRHRQVVLVRSLKLDE